MQGLTGTGVLLRLALRRDRLILPLTAVALGASTASAAKATYDLYPDQTAIDHAGGLFTAPAVTALYGAPTDVHSADSLAAFKMVVLGAVLTGVLGIVIVRRHTRTEEEEGRLELVGAGAVGRYAALAAAVVTALLGVLACAVLATLGMLAVGAGARGSVALGACWLVAGLVFTGVSAVGAQLTSTTRGAALFAFGVLGVSYLVRALADAGGHEALLWASPLGWAKLVSPYGRDRFWVLALGLLGAAALLALAVALLARRDLGAGLWHARPGPASGRVRGAHGLAWRLQRGGLGAWVVGFAVLGAVVGSISGSIESMLDARTREMLQKMGGSTGSVLDTYFSTEFGVSAVLAAALGIAVVLRLRSEETSGRAEWLLARPLPRVRLVVSHLLIALAASALVLAVAGCAAGLLASGYPGSVPSRTATLTRTALGAVPSAWVVVGLATLLVGVVPRRAALAWGALMAFFVVGEFGNLIGLPGWLLWCSPFTHVTTVPGAGLDAGPMLGLLAATAVLVGAGLAAYRRRDIPA